MNCSHGLAYEVKCSMCYSEAMARVFATEKTEGVKNSVPMDVLCGVDKGLHSQVDSIQLRQHN